LKVTSDGRDSPAGYEHVSLLDHAGRAHGQDGGIPEQKRSPPAYRSNFIRVHRLTPMATVKGYVTLALPRCQAARYTVGGGIPSGMARRPEGFGRSGEVAGRKCGVPVGTVAPSMHREKRAQRDSSGDDATRAGL
jgi:hypothetical protein